MELVFLGTSAGRPTLRRNVQAVALRLETGEVLLFDSGEGTQQQLLRVNEMSKGTKLRAANIEWIFVTHLHGDHCFGLPGLLCHLDVSDALGPIGVFGPVGTRAMLRCAFTLSRTELKRGYYVKELVGGPDDEQLAPNLPPHPNERSEPSVELSDDMWCVLDAKSVRVDAAPVDHGGIPCVAYRVQEPPRMAKLRADVVRAKALQAAMDPKTVFASIRVAGRADLADGTALEPADIFVGAKSTIPGRKVVIFGDCRPTRRHAALRLTSDADVVVHEATLDDEQADLAYARGHSTPKDAGRLARDANARLLVLWHFSPRYDHENSRDEDSLVALFKAQASACGNDARGAYEGQVIIASDFLRIPVPRRTGCFASP